MSSPVVSEALEVSQRRQKLQLIAIGLLSIYLFMLFWVAAETRRRSVSLAVPPENADYLSIAEFLPDLGKAIANKRKRHSSPLCDSFVLTFEKER